MRPTWIALACLALTAGCGDDGKTAPRGAPAAPPVAPAEPTPTPGVPPAPSLPGPAPTAPSPWATTRVGDWATWDVRVAGTDAVTKLTWRATRVDATGVRYAVDARTLDLQGVTLSTVTTEELHAAGDGPLPDGIPEAITVARTTVDTRRSVRTEGGAEVTLWHAPTVPFSGLVKSASATVEQVLVGFGRGP